MALERQTEGVTEVAFASCILPHNDEDFCTTRLIRSLRQIFRGFKPPGNPQFPDAAPAAAQMIADE